jgi:hypothetical protein
LEGRCPLLPIANLIELKSSILVNKCILHIYTVWLNLFLHYSFETSEDAVFTSVLYEL